MYVHDNNVTYFDSFGVEHIPRELIKLIGSENITTIEYYNYRIHIIMCRYFCIGFIDFMLNGKGLLEHTN